MKVLIDGKEYDLTPDSNGFVSVTFTKETKDPIQISPIENCNGTTLIDNIQLEQADKATAYEDPALIQGEATGLIKDIRGLEYAINDPVNGLRSQLTILAQGFEAEVADAIGNYSVQGQTIDGLFSEIKSIDGNLNQLVRNAEGNNQLISSLQNDVAQNRLDYHSLKETADSYERIIGSSQADFENNVSRAVQTSGLIQQEVASLTSGLSTTVSQLEDSWAMQLKDGNDLKTALNATTDGLRLKGDLIHLDGLTHVDGDFWAKEINAIQINADNIVSGQIDASKIRVINLDVNSLSGNMSEFIQTYWQQANGNHVRIDGSGMYTTGSGDWRRTYFTPTGMDLFNGYGNKAGAIGYFKANRDYQNGNYGDENIMWGDRLRHTIGVGVNYSHVLSLGYVSSSASVDNGYNDALTVDPQASGKVSIHTSLDMLSRPIENAYRLNFRHGGYIFGQQDSSVYYNASIRHDFAIAGAVKLAVDTTIRAYTGIDMNGNDIARVGTISQISDERLKMNIKPTGIKALEAIMRWKLVEYDWIADGSHVDIGLLSQRTPEIMTYDRESDTYGIDAGKQTMMNTLAIQELNQKVDNRIFHVDSEIAELKQEIKQLKEEVAYLKGA